MELANLPKPDDEKKMDVEDEKAEKDDSATTAAQIEDEDEDMKWTAMQQSDHRKSRSKAVSRAGRIAKRKPRNQVVFPSELARRKRSIKAKKG